MLPRFRLFTLMRSGFKPELHLRVAAALRLALVVAAVACSSDTTPAAVTPTAPTAASFSSTAADDSDNDERKEHQRLIRQRDSVRNEAKRIRESTRQEWQNEWREWVAYQRDWKEYKKDNKDARVEILRCQPQPYAADAEVIGPNGGVLHIGPHSLVVPKGALDREVLLVGSAPTSSRVEVKFGPHGLQFESSALLVLSYDHCMRPDNFTYRIVYVENGRVQEFPPSKDDKTLKKVAAKIDHFSGYMIAY
jgi:hypothetical protein